MPRRSRLLALGALAAGALLVPAGASAQTKSSPQPKIVGGSPVSISQYPWQAAVAWSPDKVSGDAHDRQFCGGSLLTSRIVITAAHCVFDTDPDCFVACHSLSPVCNSLSDPPPGDGTCRLDADDVDAVLGRTTLSQPGGAEVSVIGTSLRSNYDPNYQGDGVPRFDVGYLVLSQASTQPQIKIARTDEAGLWAPGSAVEISGWGLASESASDTEDSLRATTVNIVDDPTCSADYSPDFDPSTMVCAAAPGRDTCNGDSGGPLEAPIGGGSYRLVGITGWGEGCAEPGFPGVYTRVADPAMASLIQSDVSALESQFGLPAEGIFGSPTSTTNRKAAKNPFAKCKRIHNKKKRKRCMKKVRKKLKKG
jgi:secreted trypsin-like serine protease